MKRKHKIYTPKNKNIFSSQENPLTLISSNKISTFKTPTNSAIPKSRNCTTHEKNKKLSLTHTDMNH